MRSMQQYSITLPLDMAEAVERKVASDGHASVSEVLREGGRALPERDAVLEKWLREDVAQAVADYRANPEGVIPVGDILKRIRARAASRKEEPGEA